MELTFIFAIILAGVVVSPLLVYIARLNSRMREKENTILDMTAELSRLKAESETFENYRKDIEAISENSKQSFTSAARELFISTSTKMTDMNRTSVEDVLKPLKEQVDALKRQVDDANIRNAKDKTSLEENIRSLMTQTQKIGDDAIALTRALKGDKKMQGNWGEALLDTILESSGLKRDVHYFTQQTYAGDNGRNMRPDVVVRLPQEDSCIIIDSKVSLNAYVNCYNAESDEEKEIFLAAHAKALRNHVDELAAKDYSAMVHGAVGFVLMFVANEASYIAAISKDPGLPEYARKRKVIIVSPANLITALQLTLLLWKSEQQKQNISNIIKAGGEIYDKFARYVANMEKVGKSLADARNAYDDAFGQLSTGKGNLIRQMERFKGLGLQTKVEISRKLLEQSDAGEE